MQEAIAAPEATTFFGSPTKKRFMPRLVATPKCDRGRKTLRIDRRFRGVGRIRAWSGVRDRKTYQRVLVMLEELYTMPEQWYLLKAVCRREITPMQLCAFY